MDLFLRIDPRFAVSGLIVGFLVGLTGAGGGSLMTPLLVMFFGIHPATAVGTDLLFTAITKTVGGAVHGARRTIDWPLVFRLGSGSVPAACVTVLVLGFCHARLESVNHVITTALGIAVIVTAIALLFRKWLLAKFSNRVREMDERTTAILTTLLGAALGALVALSSVGAGAIGVSALMMLYPRIAAGKIVGSDIAHAVPLAVIAGIGHWYLGSVDWSLLASLLVGSLPGIVLGSMASSRGPDQVIRFILAGMLLVVGTILVFY